MILIATTTVGVGGAGLLEFANIPQTFTDLYVVFNVRATDAGSQNAWFFQMNSTYSAHDYRDLIGNGSTPSSTSATNVSSFRLAVPGASTTTNTFGNIGVYIPNYANTTTYKTASADAVIENNATGASGWNQILAGVFNSTSAVTNVRLLGGTAAQYSTASLYGIQKDNGYATVA